MKIAEKFGRPVFTFIDLAGANPGIGAEERGQGEAIARNLIEMSRLRVPTIATITGEGGSGGALALAVADRVLMLENAIYSVISPEGCASIMWKDASKKQQAAAALKYTAGDVKLMGCVDDVLREPRGGTQNDPAATMAMVGEKLAVPSRLSARPAPRRHAGAALHQVPQYRAVLHCRLAVPQPHWSSYRCTRSIRQPHAAPSARCSLHSSSPPSPGFSPPMLSLHTPHAASPNASRSTPPARCSPPSFCSSCWRLVFPSCRPSPTGDPHSAKSSVCRSVPRRGVNGHSAPRSAGASSFSPSCLWRWEEP